MKEKYIEGLNGSIRLKEKYIEIELSDKKNGKQNKYYIKYNELKDVVYKKPTRDKYGYIKIYLYTLDKTTNEEIKYNIILDKIYEKEIDENKKVYEAIKRYTKQNKNKQETKVEDKKENPIPVEQKEKSNEKTIPVRKHKVGIVKITKAENKVQGKKVEVAKEAKKEEKKYEIKYKQITKKGNIKKDSKDIVIPVIGIKENIKIKKDIVNTKLQEDIKDTVIKKKKNKKIEKKTSKKAEKKGIDEKVTDLASIELFNNTNETLFKKLENAKYELNQLYYKYYILSKYHDNSTKLEEIEKLIVEIEKLIRELEKIKKEFDYFSEKNIQIKIDKNNLEGTRNDLYNYLILYREVAKEAENIEIDCKKLDKDLEEDKEKLNITDKQLEKDLNRLYGVESNKEFLEKYLSEINEKLGKIHTVTENIVEHGERTKVVLGEITDQTKRMMALGALSMAKPGISRVAGTALMINAGTNALKQMLPYERVKVKYTDYITKEKVVIPDEISFSNINSMLRKSKEDVNEVINRCSKYEDNPKYNELKKELKKAIQMIEDTEKKVARAKEVLEKYQTTPEKKNVITIEEQPKRKEEKEERQRLPEEPQEEINNRRRR